MRKLILSVIVALSVLNFAVAQKKAKAKTPKATKEIKVAIDLNQVKDDKVMVTITPPAFTATDVVFHIPKTVPGTYSADDYGKLIVDLKALDKTGKELTVEKTDVNSWKISNAKALSKITYWVNDTYDTETGRGFGKDEIFSPAGTNINEGKNFMINSHGFVGYFDDKTEIPYNVTITHPAGFFGATSLVDTNKSDTVDNFLVKRYFELTDNPIMYAKPDYEIINVDGMEILFSVYSPNGEHSAKSLLPYLEKTLRAQKAFLGPINNNKKYTVLLYLSEKRKDAKGYGALEHHTSTTVVFPEMMSEEILGEQIKDVVSHEFFHIVTPLSIHSKEIQYFDYNNPKMSKHLWMYEGVTEYFANLFQVNQGLIDADEFYQRMDGKITNAATLNDTMPFTEMSANVLVKPYKDQYLNVYEKGALIGMCIDIIIREKSNGQRGILDLMQKLSKEYGPNKPFNDDELFAKITSLTYPEVGEFLNTYVAGPTPIPYNDYFAKMGVGKTKMTVTVNPFLKDQSTAYVTADGKTKEIIVAENKGLNEFMTNLGLQDGDVIVAINDKAYNLDSIYDMIMESQNWKVDDPITIKIRRAGKEETIKGKVKLATEEVEGYGIIDASKQQLNNAWLKGK